VLIHGGPIHDNLIRDKQGAARLELAIDSSAVR
jgi:hypothetical protein